MLECNNLFEKTLRWLMFHQWLLEPIEEVLPTELWSFFDCSPSSSEECSPCGMNVTCKGKATPLKKRCVGRANLQTTCELIQTRIDRFGAAQTDGDARIGRVRERRWGGLVQRYKSVTKRLSSVTQKSWEQKLLAERNLIKKSK